MYKGIVTIILAILIQLVFTAAYTYSQNIKIKITPGPQGQLKISQLWNFTITNKDADTYKVTLEGSITNSKDGKVLILKSSEFSVPSEFCIYNFNNTPNGTYQILNDKYNGLETGSPPPGKYTLCLKLIKEKEYITKDCLEITIEE
jgi:hypothetical protein